VRRGLALRFIGARAAGLACGTHAEQGGAELGLGLSSGSPREKRRWGWLAGPTSQREKERKGEGKEGGNNLASRLEWQASLVMGQNWFG
jgi:hypothetical protein